MWEKATVSCDYNVCIVDELYSTLPRILVVTVSFIKANSTNQSFNVIFTFLFCCLSLKLALRSTLSIKDDIFLDGLTETKAYIL